ncbi:hypothetical protein Tco_0397375 [Tanacetum coccineum]
MNNDDKDTAKKHVVFNKPELNDHMMDWIIAKYGKPNANWTDSLFDIIADDVYTTFFINQSMPNVYVPECSKKEDQQEVVATDVIEPYQEIIIIDSNSSSSAELELPSSDEFDSLEKIVSNKGPSKKVKDEKHEEEDETYETNDKEEELWSPKTKGKTNQEKEQVRKGKRKLGV